MAFTNPSINNLKSNINEEEITDIKNRLSIAEEEIKSLKMKLNENNNIESKKEQFSIENINVEKAILSGKPRIVNIPIKNETNVEEKEKFTICDITKYVGKTFMAGGNQRVSLLNEEQYNKLIPHDSILTIESIMKN